MPLTRKESNMDKEIFEGWTARDFIRELEPVLDLIQSGNSWRSPIKTKAELKEWTINNQPYYNKPIPAVINYFAKKYGITK